MAPKCTICHHPEVDAINQDILSGTPIRHMVERYGVSMGSLQRHKNHIPEALTRAKEAEVVCTADALLTDLQQTKETALWFLNEAREAKDLRAAAPLISSACKVIELLAEVRGQIDRKAEINIILNPEFVQFKQNILSVVNSCPECKRRLLEALK
jgi:hypothetical protein